MQEILSKKVHAFILSNHSTLHAIHCIVERSKQKIVLVDAVNCDELRSSNFPGCCDIYSVKKVITGFKGA
jgi:hypothetical protein